MFYVVIKRFDSLRGIIDSIFSEVRKYAQLGVRIIPRRSTLTDADVRWSESVFESIFRDLYATYGD